MSFKTDHQKGYLAAAGLFFSIIKWLNSADIKIRTSVAKIPHKFRL